MDQAHVGRRRLHGGDGRQGAITGKVVDQERLVRLMYVRLQLAQEGLDVVRFVVVGSEDQDVVRHHVHGPGRMTDNHSIREEILHQLGRVAAGRIPARPLRESTVAAADQRRLASPETVRFGDECDLHAHLSG